MIQAESRMPSTDGVRAAADAVAAILPPTPLLPVEIGGVRAWVKADNLQPIGSFKTCAGRGVERAAAGDQGDHRDAA